MTQLTHREREEESRSSIDAMSWPRPTSVDPDYRGTGKLDGKVALISGGDSGLGRAVAILFAKEGADIALVYRDEHESARETRDRIEAEGRLCVCIAGDVGDELFCREAVSETVRQLDRLDILLNNTAEQEVAESIEDITSEQLVRTFRTNIFSCFFLAQAALQHMQRGGCIINTACAAEYRDSDHLVDYAATKGAIVSFTRSLSASLGPRGIRVNAVAPGPMWAPAVASGFRTSAIPTIGKQVPTEAARQPAEIAPSYVFLASGDASHMNGQVLHPNSGEYIYG